MRRNDVWVVDASVSAKWYLGDEELSDQAMSLLSGMRGGKLELRAPNFARHEVGALLTNASRSGRVSWDTAHVELKAYIEAGISASEDPLWLLGAAMETAKVHPLSFYDALYVALAERLAANLVTADQRMYRGLRGRAPFVVWLGDLDL
ncbi:MAG TPA: type II toxin-antitoxin system VapC family toxin [Dehalococcoidia bacterium]|nr:type II toxin-antitoxin system VapC family toxin [Dehalococcoidia bacterium]